MFCPNCGKEVKGSFCSECGTRVNNNKNGNITLKVTRKKKVMGFAIPFPVYVDGEQIGSLTNGATLTCNISEGPHKVVFKCVEKEISRDIEVNSSHTEVEIICHARMGLVAALVGVDEINYK